VEALDGHAFFETGRPQGFGLEYLGHPPVGDPFQQQVFSVPLTRLHWLSADGSSDSTIVAEGASPVNQASPS
jgi:hypothetical protein